MTSKVKKQNESSFKFKPMAFTLGVGSLLTVIALLLDIPAKVITLKNNMANDKLFITPVRATRTTHRFEQVNINGIVTNRYLTGTELYEIQNIGDTYLTIKNVFSKFQAQTLHGSRYELIHSNNHQRFSEFKDFKEVSAWYDDPLNNPAKLANFPYVIPPHSKIFLNVKMDYKLAVDGKVIGCGTPGSEKERKCAWMNSVVFGNKESSLKARCRRVSYKVVARIEGLNDSLEFSARDLLLWTGCFLNTK